MMIQQQILKPVCAFKFCGEIQIIEGGQRDHAKMKDSLL